MAQKYPKRPRQFAVSLPRLTILPFVVMFAAVGLFSLLTSGASAPPSLFQVAFNRTLCMVNLNNSSATSNPVEIRTCNSGDNAQLWSLQNVTGGLLIKANAGTCAADPGSAVGTSSSTKVYVKTASCNSGDHTQIWKWSGAQLQNAYNNGCINDPGSATGQGTWLVVYPCSPVTNNAEWDRVTVTLPAPSVSITSPGSGATVSGTGVSVAAKASESLGSIVSITLKVAGLTLGTCSNSTSCSAAWNSKSVGNGTYTVQAIATNSAGGSTQASESIKVSNAVASSGSTSTKSGGSSGSKSGSSGSTVKVKSPSRSGSVSIAPSGTGNSAVTVTQNPGDATLANPSTQANNSGPTVYDIIAGKITSSSLRLSWQAGGSESFTLRYGPNQNKPAKTLTVNSAASNPALTLTGLPSGTRIYVSVTPHGNGQSGAMVSTSFKTLSVAAHSGGGGGGGGSIIWIILLLLVVAGVVVFLRRRIQSRQSLNLEPQIDTQHLQLYPEEDSATQAARLNWWMPDDQRQAMAQHQGQPQQQPGDEPPDMFDEGRKRLEEEEKRRNYPGA